MTNPVDISEAEVEKHIATFDEVHFCQTISMLRTLRTALTSVTAERNKARNNALKESADAAPDTAGYIARIAYNEGYCEGITKYRNAIRALQHTEGQSE